MKQVIKVNVIRTVVLEDVSIHNHYGVQNLDSKSGNKGWIECHTTTGYRFRTEFSINSPTRLDGLNLDDCIEKLIDSNYKVFEFESEHELINWLFGRSIKE